MRSVRFTSVARVAHGPLPSFTRGLTRSLVGVLASVLCGVLILGGAGGCASSGTGGAQHAGGMLSFTTWPAGRSLQIVSDTWILGAGYEGESPDERRADFYRKNVYRADGTSAAVKVCEDEVFSGLKQALDDQGFARFATQGAAPTASGTPSQVLELVQDGAATHFLRARGMPAEQATAFVQCVTIFGEVFNVLDGFQSGDKEFRFKE